MLRRDKFVVCVILINCTIAYGFRTYRAGQCGVAHAPGIESFRAEAVIGEREMVVGPNRPYTLVEFGDYQCPPCARAAPVVTALQRKYGKNLRFVFRHCPLTRIHGDAFEIAVSAEAAREQGRFLQMHEMLYDRGGKVDAKATVELAMAVGLDMARFKQSCKSTALASVNEDSLAAKRLSVEGTPTFFLCLPSGRVLRLGSVEQAQSFID